MTLVTLRNALHASPPGKTTQGQNGRNPVQEPTTTQQPLYKQQGTIQIKTNRCGSHHKTHVTSACGRVAKTRSSLANGTTVKAHKPTRPKSRKDKSRKQRSKPGMWPTLSTASSRRQGAQSTDDRVASATIKAFQNFIK